MSDWPAPHHPIDRDGQVDTSVTVGLFPHLPGRTEELRAWCDGDTLTVGGQPVVLVPGTRPSGERLAGLGDVVVQTAPEKYRARPGAGIGARYQPVDLDEAPPADRPEE